MTIVETIISDDRRTDYIGFNAISTFYFSYFSIARAPIHALLEFFLHCTMFLPSHLMNEAIMIANYIGWVRQSFRKSWLPSVSRFHLMFRKKNFFDSFKFLIVYFKHIYTLIQLILIFVYSPSWEATPVFAPNVWANENSNVDTRSRESNSEYQDFS